MKAVKLRKQCGFTWGYISNVEKMIKSNKPPLNFSTSLYNTYKRKCFNVLFFIETSIQKYLTDCGGFNSRYGYRLAMTRGKFVMRSNIRRASHKKEYFHFHGYFLFDLNQCQARTCYCLPAVAAWVRVPFGTLGQVLNDHVTMLQKTHYGLCGFLRLLELVGSVVRFQS